MHYTEVVLDENNVRMRLNITRRIELLAMDVEEFTSPEVLPNAHQIAELTHTKQKIGNNMTRTEHDLLKSLEEWREKRDRIRMAVGGSNALDASDTGTKRKTMTQIVSATWGPVDRQNPHLEQGIKRNISNVEYMTALQLRTILEPNITEENIKRVEYSYDDLVRTGESAYTHLTMLRKEMESKHFDLTNLTKLVVGEGYERRAIEG